MTGMRGAADVKASAADLTLAERLRAGDEEAFTQLVERYHGSLIRFARLFVTSPALAEDVVQDTWLAVLRGVRSFQGRSALKTWIFSILANRAKTRAVREKRTMAFSALSSSDLGDDPAFAADRFTAAGTWATTPRHWDWHSPEALLLQQEALSVVETTMAVLSPSQRAVVTLRDIEGIGAAGVCQILEISEANQRVLLHRGRSHIRSALERYALGT